MYRFGGRGLQPESLGCDRPGRISWCSVPSDDREASDTNMNLLKRRGWVLLPIVASMATQCDTTPRGVTPSPIASVELVLESLSAPPASDANGFAACLNRWDVNDDENHLRPSWRANDPVALVEASPNVFTADFPGCSSWGLEHHDRSRSKRMCAQSHWRWPRDDGCDRERYPHHAGCRGERPGIRSRRGGRGRPPDGAVTPPLQ